MWAFIIVLGGYSPQGHDCESWKLYKLTCSELFVYTYMYMCVHASPTMITHTSLVCSESSMFISKNRFILKTCGSTTLLYAIEPLISLVQDYLPGATVMVSEVPST